MDDSVEVAQNINVFLEAPPVSANNAITNNQEINQQEVPQDQEIQVESKEDNQHEDTQSKNNNAAVNQEINNEPNVKKKSKPKKKKQKADMKHPLNNIEYQNNRPNNIQSNVNQNDEISHQLNQNKSEDDNRYIQTEEQVMVFNQNKTNNEVNIIMNNDNKGNIIINNVEFQQAIINNGIMQVNNGDNNIMNNNIQTTSNVVQPEKQKQYSVTYDLLLYPFLINAIALAICGAVFAYFAFVKIDKIVKYFDKDLDGKISVIGFLILLVTCFALKYAEVYVLEGCITFGSLVFYLLQLGGLVSLFVGYCFFPGDTEADYKEKMKDPQQSFYYMCIGTFGSAIADFSLFVYLAISKEKYKRALLFIIPILLTIIAFVIFGLAKKNWALISSKHFMLFAYQSIMDVFLSLLQEEVQSFIKTQCLQH